VEAVVVVERWRRRGASAAICACYVCACVCYKEEERELSLLGVVVGAPKTAERTPTFAAAVLSEQQQFAQEHSHRKIRSPPGLMGSR